ncbi:MAG: hypothetical protein GTO54_00335, partial [Nitrososphaeria archaeon]|nr:hypothetical protein [Nitrososphaeria archaeon]
MLQEIVHVCIVVRDVEVRARAFAEKFGIGPWRIRVVSTPSNRASVRGEPVDYTLKFGHARVGPVT